MKILAGVSFLGFKSNRVTLPRRRLFEIVKTKQFAGKNGNFNNKIDHTRAALRAEQDRKLMAQFDFFFCK
jgi:hypothetical protein